MDAHKTQRAAGGDPKAKRTAGAKPEDTANPTAPQAITPEYGRSWHAFVCWATMAGHVVPGRMVEVVLSELDEVAL